MPTPSAGYITPNGDKVPGTTTIIGRFKDSGGLIQWAYKQGREHEGLARQGKDAPRHLYDQVQQAADIGTTVHKMVEEHINGVQTAVVQSLAHHEHAGDEKAVLAALSGFDAYLKWERGSQLEIVAQEIQLVSEQYHFGGTPDAIGEIDGELCLVDWKTSNAVYADHLIQLAAYKHLIEEGQRMDNYKSMDMKLTGGFHLCRFSKAHGDFAHHYYPRLDEAWEAFKHMRQLYRIDKTLKKRAA